MGKPNKPQVFRLLRSCLFFSGHKRNKEEAEAMDDVKLELGGGDHPDDGEGDVSAAVSSSPQPPPPPQLPEDIIFDVLARLPVKTLCRFRCVCKAWRGLISSPAFGSAQASRAAAPLVAGVFGTPRPFDRFRPARAPWFLPEPSLEVRVMDPADGGSVVRVVKDVRSSKLMMCGAQLGRLVMVDQGELGARVIDPATGRLMVLDGGSTTTATTTVLYSHGRTAAVPGAGDDGDDNSNAVQPCRLWYHNLGRATPSGAYKVVRLRDVLAKNGAVQICHVTTVPWPWDDDDDDDIAMEPTTVTCWRQRPEPPILTCCCSSCTAIVNGVLHFMKHKTPSHSGRPWNPSLTKSSPAYIASFDLESEEWKPTVISGPPVSKHATWDKQDLAALKGSLCLIQTDRVGSCYCTNIWFLVDSEKSIWVKEYAIQIPESWYFFRPLEILVDGRILMLNALKKKGGNLRDVQCVLQLYHPSTGALADLMEMGNDFRGPLTLYTGNLFS